ncbi:MAG TPA: hypothetical protein VJK07_00345 [Candidatus Nanoarchaeia archaeon]|nr:hypothetical protein [Candidatus Nanoarchaeia archaeon]
MAAKRRVLRYNEEIMLARILEEARLGKRLSESRWKLKAGQGEWVSLTDADKSALHELAESGLVDNDPFNRRHLDWDTFAYDRTYSLTNNGLAFAEALVRY